MSSTFNKELKNVWDMNSEQSTCSFFAPAYMNVMGAYDKNGNSDVIRALVEIVRRRLTVKYGASDVQALARESAESPVTPQDATWFASLTPPLLSLSIF